MNPSFRSKLFGRVLQLISWWTQRTATLNVAGLEHVRAIRAAGKPVLWTTWHGQSMLLSTIHLQKLWRQRVGDPENVAVMIPDDWRGETLYAWLSLVGLMPQPMNLESRDMGTARKLARMIRQIKQLGYDNFVAPDGPSGPAYEAKPGIAYIAQKLDAPILPIAGYTRTAYVVYRWDAYVIPFPFSRIEVVIGKPLDIPRKVEPAVVKEQVTNALNRATLQAKANYYAERGH